MCNHNGEIYEARRRVKWPGQAAVIVSVVHAKRGNYAGNRLLDERVVPTITAFLFHRGGDDDPVVLTANENKSFQGSIILGLGFTFDDTSLEKGSNSLSQMKHLVEADPKNQARIYPYLGGEELNNSPRHEHHRYVIGFQQMSEDEARHWHELMDIVEARVKPERLKLADNADGRRRRQYWWQWGRYTPALYESIRGLRRVLVCGQTSKYRSFTFVNNGMVYDQKLIVFPFDAWAPFCALSSRLHEAWALFFGSTLEDRPVYTPSDCFETFPFPPNWETDPRLEEVGKVYYDFRAALMVRNNEGLTKTYNRFHDPDESDPDILKLRELHAAMDSAVLDAYGWTDIQPTCEFILDYEEDEDDESGGKRRKKKPWRYRWPDEIRDEVLARLLELNAQRAKEEAAARDSTRASVPDKPKKKPKTPPKGDKTPPTTQGSFGF